MKIGKHANTVGKNAANIAALLLVPCLLAIFFYSAHPFKDCLLTRRFSLRELNPAQRANIDIAARRLDGRVIKSGETFSFNKVLGPRSDARGYRAAASYLGKKSPSTVGGGICLLSSGIYQAALAAGLEIVERNPHLRTVASVEPGLDATVWWGQCDLKFKNNTACPLELKVECKNQNLYVSLYGQQSQLESPPAELKTVLAGRNSSELLVESFRVIDNRRIFVARDHYRLN